MDAFDFDNVKAEKARAMRRHNILQIISNTFRIVEICIALVILSWIFTRLPFAVKTSGDCARRLSGIIGSPLFVFIIGNAIIVTLVAKSGRVTGETSIGDYAETEIYEEYLKNSGGDRTKSPSETGTLSREPEEVEYQEKQIISELNMTSRTLEDQAEIDTCTVTDLETETETDLDFPKVYRRTQSVKLKQENTTKTGRELRRSETEKCRKTETSGDNPREKSYSEDNLSNEEFQRTIEAFIAKQMRFLREESLAIVVKNQS
ncbi:tRNA-methyltransferase non-catalytic subunit trm6MTase subunit [Quillaja saponaria]|uniref:tRNA-methyltransferase non-catalytic subunit trm6MTase subunit n=1 Tax=Quillaja saponaria TaxID=32244 RepID=A0AAD7P6S9_QUISA|nr:tRNA-methyltransferase non-catalytic subunit trm6MTase subunit [Quillaja saponaria]